MKKKLITLFICFLCFITVLSGCNLGSFIVNNKDKGGNTVTPGDSNDPDDPDIPPVVSYDYTVTVYYNNLPFKPGDNDITAVWYSNEGIFRAPLGKDGKANAGVLYGDYYVYLEGLPSKYTYNPGAYKATDDERNVTILLTDIKKPVSGDGSGYYIGTGVYVVNDDGTYRAEIKTDGQEVYYQYTPTSSGWYKIESWVNVFEDSVDPVVTRWAGNSQFVQRAEEYKDGGFALEGGYTKNFRYDVQVGETYVGNAFTFSVTAASKFSEYPVYVDFAIVYIGKYKSSEEDVRIIRAKEAKVKAAEPQANETFVWADWDPWAKDPDKAYTLTFDASNFKYNEDTGFYHHYSMELYGEGDYGTYDYGKGYGPRLLCSIKNPIKSCSLIPTLFDANAVVTPYGKVNYLLIYNVWLEAEQAYVTHDYQEFIRTDYGNRCNSKGYCYVTPELKNYLQLFAEENGLWTDGVDDFNKETPERKGYHANQDSLWLFACGFYKKNEDKNEQKNS